MGEANVGCNGSEEFSAFIVPIIRSPDGVRSPYGSRVTAGNVLVPVICVRRARGTAQDTRVELA